MISCSNPKQQEKNPLFDKIIQNVSISEIEKTISELVGFETRYSHEKQLEVADYLFKRQKQYMTDTEFHEYDYWGVKWKNVVGTIRGKIYPNEIVIACAHLDSKSEKQLVYAPGADDNASGCAAVMELSRILPKYSFERTIKLIFFSRESYGQQGSKAYVKDIDRNKEKIITAINLDMIAYGSEGEDIDLVTIPKYSWLTDQISDLAELYNFYTKSIIDKDCY
jgi:Zn-dependent M28 family amino/carboxypeptidase